MSVGFLAVYVGGFFRGLPDDLISHPQVESLVVFSLLSGWLLKKIFLLFVV